ncbi:SDR family NAD(P)-dependent oxidoreductase [Hyphobacterium sp. HN65]|uniref:SDR family NAD(P)-dependent oxidoreductase n=1 Tax=Hyphobacterium lacteum TaxID=3116575 RepID=A0ABU7LQ62_9PROT|nr:SDR family NAD(P)-dependent oxidoreductase [Hyphobacterium sp. HN65]MEE2526032.1 SDR family NAD(P)-dependent oxidoreductase [Hyphobacterium sp. HN65]
MDLEGKIAIVTGGAGGIGAAVAREFHSRGVKVACCDLDGEAAHAVASECGGFGKRVNVADEGEMAVFISEVERDLGPVDIFYANAGVGYMDGPLGGAGSAPNANWEKAWNINVMQAVYGARLVIPGMAKRGGGAFMITASAAGLLAQIGDAAYSATKAAAISLAESISISHGDDGIQAHAICPQYVKTNMTKDLPEVMTSVDGMISAEDAAKTIVDGVAENRFLILTHPVVADHFAKKAGDRDRWLGGMRKLRRMLMEMNGGRVV